jgi:HSP20 family protein
MAIIRWYDPPEAGRSGHLLDRLQREMNRIFTDFSRGAPSRVGVFPSINLSEDQENLYLRSELPGIRPEELDISVEGETITLRGERKLAETGENVSYHRREREAGRFRRIISLPSKIDTEAVNATFKNGILKIVLPKAKEAQPKQIKIQTG